MVNLLSSLYWFPEWLTISFPATMNEGSLYPQPHQRLFSVCLLILDSDSVRWNCKVVLVGFCPIGKDEKHFLRCFLASFMSSIGNYVQTPSPFFNLLFIEHFFIQYILITVFPLSSPSRSFQPLHSFYFVASFSLFRKQAITKQIRLKQNKQKTWETHIPNS